jgi:hypothetical protein
LKPLVVVNREYRIAAKLIFCFFIVVVASISRGQCQAPTAAIEKWFDKTVGIENSGVINGPEYRMEMRGASSNPFFDKGEAQGMIRYNNEVFFVPLLYDIYKDVIIVKHLSNLSGAAWFVQPDKKLVEEFIIADRLFRNFDRGYHQVLFENNDFALVSRRAKITQVRKGIFNYIEADRFFIVSSNRWTTVWGKKSFIKMLAGKEDKKKLKLFINQQQIKVRKFRDEDLVKVATFFATLQRHEQQ